MLAYLFWHEPAVGVAPAAYEESLRAFHRALSEHPPGGYLGSAAFGFRGAPWFPAEPGYLDWYTVADFTSLGLLNEAAVAGARKAPHDNAARMAGAGVGGLSKLVAGSACLEQTNCATWLAKPNGEAYDTYLAQAGRLIDPATMGLWQRQMTIGPGLEFCITTLAQLRRLRRSVPYPFHCGESGVACPQISEEPGLVEAAVLIVLQVL